MIYQKYLKRVLDIVISLSAIVLLSPILFVVAFLVKVKLGSPVVFCQKRPGKNEKIFNMYKFRSMTNASDENGNLLPDDIRLTKFGKKLRNTSLDELPELFNILKGDMSIVGPRPLLIKDLVFMTNDQRDRHMVRQGLTGLAQISGRNNIDWEKKLSLDLIYVKKVTFLNDLKILVLTIFKVIKKDGISAEGMETAEDLGDYLLRNNRISQELYDDCIKRKQILEELEFE